MDFSYEFFTRVDDGNVRKQVWEILCGCDSDFVPTLSSRESSFQADFTDVHDNTIKPKTYFDVMIEQYFILACEEPVNRVVGFMSFIHDYTCEQLQAWTPCNYITTICVRKEYRNKGIAKKFYKFMEEGIPEGSRLKYLTTRTWSTNRNHIHILDCLGFEKITVIRNHRGGGIDTVYFGKISK